MTNYLRLVCLCGLVLLSSAPVSAQEPRTSVSVPRLIRVSGTLTPADGRTLAQVETVTLRLYAQETGDAVLWEETQHVTPDAGGRYAVLLGSTRPDGIPVEIFQANEPRWLGTTLEGVGEKEAPRVRLVSVPYALRASDADTLGGLPASAFLKSADATASTPGRSLQADSPSEILPGTPTALAKYSSATDLSQSNVWDIGGMVGINTLAPRDALHVQFTNTSGGMTGLAVQNMGNTSTSFSGMLFFDHNGVLGQFQGFNNLTHEYRINNIARNGASQFDGSINFMTGSTSRFFVSAAGNVGVGTTTPASGFEVSNALSGNITGNVFATTFGNVTGGSLFVGRKFRGVSGAPTQVMLNDTLAFFGGSGYGTSTLGPTTGFMAVRAAQNFTDAARGTSLAFGTTPLGSATPVQRMIIDPDGDVGIGTTPFFPEGALEVSRTGVDPYLLVTAFEGEPHVITRVAGGAPGVATAVTEGTELGVFAAGGFNGLNFNNLSAGFGVFAAEDWSPTANGSALVLATTPLGATEPAVYISILPNGFVGIGTPQDPEGAPTATDRLQVFGDIRVGDSGVNGCVKSFDGNPLIGTCASDGRFKKNVTSFASMLTAVSSLRPVHYDWRTDDFPDRHFSANRSYGLIAQEVEQVMPDLVVTGADGYKAVNYTKLPLLAIQAIKELKSENDALQARVAELERLVKTLAADRR